jgi:putative transposase
MLKLHGKDVEEQAGEVRLTLDEMAREGARRMLAAALETEVRHYLVQHAGARDEVGHALVVRNGSARPRKVTLGAGTVEIKAPRVNDRRVVGEERQRFTSDILPRYMRRSPKVSEVLPVLYLRGLSSGDFRPALSHFFGVEASAGMSPSAISALLSTWEAEYRAYRARDLSQLDYVYVWADGVHFRIRLEEDRLCALVVIGVRPDGTKELLAIEDGYRESAESWSSVLRDLSERGMRAPVVAVADSALGFWKALGTVWPETREQRCWVHRLANVLDKLPKRLQPRAKDELHQIMRAPNRASAKQGIARFEREYQAKYPKAVESLSRDQEALLTFFDYPAEHWQHLRTTNPIESSFSTVRLRQRVTKGAGSRTRGLVFAYKLLDMASKRWRKLNGAALLPLVRAGLTCKDGVLVERQEIPLKEAA